jgi:Nif-specific regulatory protein
MHIDVAEPIRLIASSSQRSRSVLAPTTKSTAKRNDPPALETVFEIAKLLTGSADPVSAMPEIFALLEAFLGLRFGSLSLIAEPGDPPNASPVLNPYVVAATAKGATPGMETSFNVSEQVVAMVFRTGLPLVSMDVVGELGADALPRGVSEQNLALVAVPIRSETDVPLVTGVLTVYRPFIDDPARDLDGDLRIISMTASLLEQAMRFRRMVARDRERMFREAGNALKALHDAGIGEDTQPVEGIVGESPALTKVIRRIRKVAPTSAQVLLRGESGTGKELFARAIHSLSDRADKPFIKVNCAALSETLLETELFGHEKGSFTGATGQKKGRFELANGGTLFLDEIGEIKHEFQTKLLRVLQEGEFERVGGTKTLKVDVRLITATNKDLERAVALGDFRADLYFRICVVPVHLPPLRDRPEDIPALAHTFLDRFNKENGTELNLDSNAMETLMGCRFPGNVRELENCIHRSAALSEGDTIGINDIACNQNACLSAELWRMQNSVSSPVGSLSAGEVVFGSAPPAPGPAPVRRLQPKRAQQSERDELIQAMEQAGWVQAKAARIMGLTPRQIGYALKKHNIEIKKL